MTTLRLHRAIAAALLLLPASALADNAAETAKTPSAPVQSADQPGSRGPQDGPTTPAPGQVAAPWVKTLALGNPPRPVRLEVRSEESGLRLRADGESTPLPLASAAKVEVEAVTLAGGAVVGVLRIVGPDGQEAGAVVTRVRGRPKVLFAGALDLRGDPGERHGHLIEVADRTGDGVADVIVAEQAERVRVCGQDRTALRPRAVDPRSLQLRPVMLDRLGAPGAGEVVQVTATTESPGPTGAPIMKGLGHASVSSSPGARELSLATPTTALTDGDPRTFWSEGRGGGGRGEFATFRWEGGAFPIRALAITPRPDATPGPQGVDVPTRLVLTGQDGARVMVTLPGDPAPGVRYWVVPPRPLAWRCLSVVFDQTTPLRGTKPGAAMLAEVEAYTALDFGEGEEQLVSQLSGGGREASAAADLMVTLGERVVPRLASAFTELPTPARKRALRVLALHVKTSAPAREALIGALPDAELRERAMDALLAAGDVGYAALAPRVSEQSALGDSVALALARRAPMKSVDPVLAAVSARGGSERPALREALSEACQRGGAPVLAPVEAWSRTQVASLSARAAVALALASTAQPAEARPLALRLLEQGTAGATDFADLWRFVQAARSLPAAPAVDAWLLKLVRDDERWMLRGAALEALVARAAAGSVEAAKAALADAYPRVRMAAASALAGRADALEPLAARVGEDRWAMVRAASLDALATTPGAVPTLVSALTDKAQLVRAAAVRGLTTARARGQWGEVKKRLLDDGEWPEVVTESIGFARSMCVHDATGVLLEVLRRGLEPNAWAPDQDVAMVAFDALLELGGESAKAAISAARSPLAPAGFATAIERTKQRKSACEGE